MSGEMDSQPPAEDVVVLVKTSDQERSHALVRWLKGNPGSSLIDAQSALGWSDKELAAAVTPEVKRLSIRERIGEYSQRFSDEQVIAALRAAWELAMPTATGLSSNRYQELVHDGAVSGPSAVRILQRFGTWAAAAQAAGVPTGTRPHRTYESAWSDEELLDHVGAYLSDPQTTGSYVGWEAWRKTNAPGAPSGPTLRNRLGSWSDIKRHALECSSGNAAVVPTQPLP
ncbi:MAG: hypothetical protein WC005_04735 [Candidatus Nanopelagicales bacterium]